MVDKVKIPKRVGPVKLSKKVRKKAKKAIKAATNPFVRDFATAAMAAAAKARGGKDSESAPEAQPYRLHYEARADVEPSKVVEAVRAAAVDGFRRFLEGLEEGLRNAEAEAAPKPPKPPKPPKSPKAPKPPKPPKARASRSSPGAAPGSGESP